jgi:hypothetical protein
MATLTQLKTQLQNANATGREHLDTLHCIELDENATTYDIMKSIAQIPLLQYAEDISNLMRGAPNDNFINRIVLPENTEYTLNLPNCTKMESAFNNIVNLTKVTFRNLNESMIFSVHRAFFGCRELEEIDFGLEYICLNSFNYAFSSCVKLKRVIGCLDIYDSEETSIMLINVPELEEIRFAEETIHVRFNMRDSAKLSSASVQSIVEALEETDDGLIITLSKALVLSDEQKATILDKGWSLVLYEK